MPQKRVHWILGTLVILGGSAILWMRKPEPTLVPAPPPPKTTPPAAGPRPGVKAQPPPANPTSRDVGQQKLSEHQLEQAFQIWVGRHKSEVSHNPYGGNSRFAAEAGHFLREARLFAAAYPQMAEKLASRVALDPAADAVERTYCTNVLAFLAKVGNSSARSVLVTLANEQDDRISAAAISGIYGTDRDGVNKALYWSKCRQGSTTAFEIVSTWLDPGTISEMKACLETRYKDEANIVLRRLEVLGSPNWQDDLSAVLLGKPSNLKDPFYWALDVMQRKEPAKLSAVLRERLDEGFSAAKSWWAGLNGVEPFETAFARHPDLGMGTRNRFYDDLLVSLFEVGGKLTPLEQARLKTFGYGCDPKERLAEILNERQ